MQRSSFRSLPAVRRKRRIEAALLAAFAACIAALCMLGARLHPSAVTFVFLSGAAAAIAVLQKETIRDARSRIVGAVLVTDRSQAPVLWDAVQACAAAAGVEPPRIHLISQVLPLPAASWGFGAHRSLGMRRDLAARLPPEFVLATVAHETAHCVMGDLRFTAALKVLRAWVRLASFGTFALGFAVLLGPDAFGRLAPAFGACLAGLACLIAPDAILTVGLHRLHYAREYAADAVGIAITGDPSSAAGLMLLFAVAGRDVAIDPRPKFGRSHPPPLARAQAIFDAYPRLRGRR